MPDAMVQVSEDRKRITVRRADGKMGQMASSEPLVDAELMSRFIAWAVGLEESEWPNG